MADNTSIDGVGHWRTPELEVAAKNGGAVNSAGIDFAKHLADSSKAMLTQLFLSLLDQHSSEATTRKKNG